MAVYCQEERALSCDSCYEISKEYCAAINVNPGLVEGQNYYLQIVDKFANRRTQQVTIKADGSFDVDTTVLPDNYFNPYAGKFELYLSSDEDGLEDIEMTFESTAYNCVVLNITKTIDNDCCE